MATRAPFTAYLRLYPSSVGTRWEKIRELEKLGYHIHQTFLDNPAIWIAQPGGGQVRSYGQFGLQQAGVAIKPRIGGTPAQATVVGFFDPYGVNAIWPDDAPIYTSPWPDTTVFHANQSLTGQRGATPWANNPNTRVATEVKALKTTIDYYLQHGLPSGIQVTVFRIDYQGATWGDGGRTFPR